MDVSRAVLDNLMGRDRNKPNDKITQRDHYSNPDVCKSFLVCFCFNTLFPNTTYDEGPCEKRHDTYLKTMFDNDIHRGPYQRQYIKQCIHWIERRLQEVEKKTKQNQAVIENKSNFPTDRPKQILDRILVIQEDIQRLITQSQKYGQQGRIDDSVRCLEEVQKLRERRKQIQSWGSDMTNAQKQQKICVICGAIQTINDTQKRVQTHLQGKIHQGFLKLRHQVEMLRIRLEVLNKTNPQQKKQDNKQIQNRNNRVIEELRQKQNNLNSQITNNNREKSASPKRKKEKKSRSRSKQRRQRQREKQRQKQKQRQRQRQRDRHHRDSRQRQRRSREKQRSKDRKQKKHHRDSRQKQHKQRHHKEHKKKHRKNHSKSRQRDQKLEY